MEGVIIAAFVVGIAFVGRLIERASRQRRMQLIAMGADDGDDADQYGTSFSYAGVPMQHGTSFDYVDRPSTANESAAVVRVEVPFIEGQFEAGQSIEPRVRPLFDRLDGYAVHRFDTRIRVSGTAAPFGSTPVPPRAKETVAVLVRCYTDSADSVIDWMLERELHDPEWFGELLVATLPDEGRVVLRARERLDALLRGQGITESRARTALRWAPVLGDEATQVVRRIAGADLPDALASSAADQLERLDPDEGLAWATDWIGMHAFRSDERAPETLRRAIAIVHDRGTVDALGRLVDATLRAFSRPDPNVPTARVLAATRAILERAAPVASDSIRLLFEDAMRGRWWVNASEESLGDALAILGLAQPPGMVAFVLAGMARAERDDLETWVYALGRYGDLSAVAPLMELADGWSGRGGMGRAAERAIAEIQDRCAKGAAGGLAVSADEGRLTIADGPGRGAVTIEGEAT